MTLLRLGLVLERTLKQSVDDTLRIWDMSTSSALGFDFDNGVWEYVTWTVCKSLVERA